MRLICGRWVRSSAPACGVQAAWAKAHILIPTGVLTGFASGAFGIGGGIVMTAALGTAVGMSQHEAVATSLCAIVPTGLAGSVFNYRKGAIDLRAAAVIGGCSMAAMVSVTSAPSAATRLALLIWPERADGLPFVGARACAETGCFLGLVCRLCHGVRAGQGAALCSCDGDGCLGGRHDPLLVQWRSWGMMINQHIITHCQIHKLIQWSTPAPSGQFY
jgi:hypothetical protein